MYEGTRGPGAVAVPECCPDGCTVKIFLQHEGNLTKEVHPYAEIHHRTVNSVREQWASTPSSTTAITSRMRMLSTPFGANCPVSEEVNKELVAPLTTEEVHVALQSMQGSSHGWFTIRILRSFLD